MTASLHDIILMKTRDIMLMMANNHRIVPSVMGDPTYPGRHNGYTDYERVMRFYTSHMDGINVREINSILKKDIIPTLRKYDCGRCDRIAERLIEYCKPQ